MQIPYCYLNHNTQKKFSFNHWWNEIDHALFFSFISLTFIGFILIASTGSIIAKKIGISDHFLPAQWWFFIKYLIFSVISLGSMIILSSCSVKTIKRIGVGLFAVTMLLLICTLFIGTEIKGAKRWVFGIQPSEFMKPGLIIFSAWLMSLKSIADKAFKLENGSLYAFCGLCIAVIALLLQPDFGQTVLITTIWTMMFFTTGANILWFGGFIILGIILLTGGYLYLPHVQRRVDAFLSPDQFDKFGTNYQSEIARKAFSSGGLLGRGPGEGEIKNTLPDAHTDYIFAVAGEELGLLFCAGIILIYGFIIWRTLSHIHHVKDFFSRYCITGLICLLGFQAFINISVNLGLFPPKGMTLPFISYGGSSLLSMGITGGVLLSLTKRKI